MRVEVVLDSSLCDCPPVAWQAVFSPVHGLHEVRCTVCKAARKLRLSVENVRIRVDRPPAVLKLVEKDE